MQDNTAKKVNKTKFEAYTINGGQCFFYLEDVYSVMLCPTQPRLGNLAAVPERIIVTLNNQTQLVLTQGDDMRNDTYGVLVTALRCIND